jgi:hypothetical protein
MTCQTNGGNILKMPKMPKSVQSRPVVMGEGSMNPHDPDHNLNLNLGPANNSLARIPSALLENGVQASLPRRSRPGEGGSRSVKLSQTLRQ